jgi:glycosyltransferase involved in cell wall biosynthesis
VSSCIGVVAIGRNEGERLRRCLSSVLGRAGKIVYVDSGSSDGSVAMARSMGVEVVELDMSQPFTAARARNAGFARVADCVYVQFVDGDCEIVAGWIELAAQQLEENLNWAIVCGRRREHYPDASTYNRLCDIEWNTPVGEARACGGDAMIRVAAFQQVGGYNPDLIAGEEPEMCVRLRQAGAKIYRLGAEMTLHDAAMTRFDQWWKRNVRAGHACAEGAAMHGRSTGHCVRETRSNWFWGLILPILILVLAWPTRGISFVLLAGYVVLAYRIRRGALKCGMSHADANLYARFTAIGKFAQAWGQLKYLLGRLSGRRSALIEYKTAPQ